MSLSILGTIRSLQVQNHVCTDDVQQLCILDISLFVDCNVTLHCHDAKTLLSGLILSMHCLSSHITFFFPRIDSCEDASLNTIILTSLSLGSTVICAPYPQDFYFIYSLLLCACILFF